MSQILPASLFCHLEFICQHILTHSKGIKTIRERQRAALPRNVDCPNKIYVIDLSVTKTFLQNYQNGRIELSPKFFLP
jgi:hypothetical protein